MGQPASKQRREIKYRDNVQWATGFLLLAFWLPPNDIRRKHEKMEHPCPIISVEKRAITSINLS